MEANDTRGQGDEQWPALDILVAPDARLSRISCEIESVKAQDILLADSMLETLRAADGIGLAAPQVGVHKRIIVVDVPQNPSEPSSEVPSYGSFAMFNPRITKSEGTVESREGCLSVPGFADVVQRHSTIDVTFLDAANRPQVLKTKGLLAVCIQHEIDHLDGKLFIDRLSRLKRDIILRKLKKFRKSGVMVVRPPNGESL